MGNKRYDGAMARYGYIRTSKALQDGQPGMKPEVQQQLMAAGVDLANLYRDVGVSGSTATATRHGWRALDQRMSAGDVLVVAAVDRLGHRWLDVTGVLKDLRSRRVRVQPLRTARPCG